MTSIFVAQLDFAATEEEVKRLFEQHGKVNRVTIAKDKETKKPRGFGFVEMFNEAEAEAAIQALDGITVKGRAIAVKKADDRPGGGKPGGGGSNFKGGRPDNRGPRDENRTDSRPPRPDNRPPRTDSRPPRTDDRGSDFPPTSPDLAKPALDKGLDRKKKDEKEVFGKKAVADRPKQHKMEAYKKSGKSRIFDEDDEDDEDWRSYLQQRNQGWEDDDDEEE